MSKAQTFNAQSRINRILVRQHACLSDFPKSVLMVKIQNMLDSQQFCSIFAPHNAVSDGQNIFHNPLTPDSLLSSPFPGYGFILNLPNMDDCIFLGGYTQNETDISFKAVAAPYEDFNTPFESPEYFVLTPQKHQLLAFIISIPDPADLLKKHSFTLHGRYKDLTTGACHFLSPDKLSKAKPKLQAVPS